MDSTCPEQIVYEALKAACDPSPELVKKAEQQLAEWDLQPGFFPILVKIFQNHQVDVNVRWIAAVYFKNGVNKYWRKNAKNEINANEKAQIRSCLLSNFHEPVPQVAVQIAALIAKIARLDCPKDWPELIPVLLEAVQTTDELQQHRTLLILLHTIKALSSKRMMADKKLFEQLTSNIYTYIFNLWDGYTTLYFQHLQDNSPPEVSVKIIEKALLTLRILRKLTIFGIHKPHTSEQCMLFLEAIFCRLKQCIECRYELQRINASEVIIERTEKFILKQMKILNEFLEQHPLSFVNFISKALEFSFNYVFHEGASMIFVGNVINFKNFAIHCINLMKGILGSTAYNSYVQENCSNDVDIPVAVTAKKEFFTNERLSYICEKIITHYFLLTQSELEQWIEDPESFAQDDGGESWKYALRPSVETFYLTIFNQFRTEMATEVVKYIQKAQEIQSTVDSDLKEILLKDAIYNAAGLAAFNLFDEIDFDAWFTNQLIEELKIPSNNFRILRRRGIWLIGRWTGVRFSRNLRPLVYSACLHLLQPSEDMSIKLAASKTLASIIDDFEFEPQPFLQYLEPSFSSLFALLKEAKECDTKMNILSTMSFIVDKMSDYIQPFADNFIMYLPLLWKESEDHNMLRCSIISTLLHIVMALGDIPEMLQQFLYSVINLSTDVNEPSHIYLMEEGLELWLAVVENSSVLTPPLLDLCKNLLPIIEISSEYLRTILFIIQAYMVLNPRTYLEQYGKSVVSTCAYLLNDLRPEGIVMIMKVFETCIRTEPEFGLEIIRPALPHIFKQIYENKDYPMVMGMYLSIIARVLIINQATFIEALQETNLPNSLEIILDVWVAKMPLVTQPEKRKLLSLALGSLLTVDNPIIRERFPGIVQNICECLNDIMKEEEDEKASPNSNSTPIVKSKTNFQDSLVFTEESQIETSIYVPPEMCDYRTYHFERYRQFDLKDPVHRIVLADYINSQLAVLKTQLDEKTFNTLLQSLDPAVLSNLNDYLQLLPPGSAGIQRPT